MKRIFGFLLAFTMLFMSASVYAYQTDIKYVGQGASQYFLTVPSKLAPGESGEVVLSGTWNSKTTVSVTAPDKVTLYNDIGGDSKALAIDFEDIALIGDNTQGVEVKENIKIAEIKNAFFGKWEGVFTYELSVKDNSYEIDEYYTSLSAALGSASGDADEATGKVGVFTDSETGKKNIVLLEDAVLTDTLNIESDVILNLNGYDITAEKNVTSLIRTKSENVVINAADSEITVNAPEGVKGTVLSVMNGSLTVNGGTYTANTSGAGTKEEQTQVIYAEENTTLSVNNAVISGTDTNNGSVNGVTGKAGSTLNLTSCEITVDTDKGAENAGVMAQGNAVLKDCTVIAKSDYTANDAGTDYASRSRGVYCEGALELYNCTVDGNHSGVTTKGSLYIDGGEYLGYGHGGLYLAGSDTVNYVYNAKISWNFMAEGKIDDGIAGTNCAGMYFGGGSSNMVLYIDNCEINHIDPQGFKWSNKSVPFYGIVFRTSSGEANNTLYISNTKVSRATTYVFRTQEKKNYQTMKLYDGAGNDFSVATFSDYSGLRIESDDSYAKQP